MKITKIGDKGLALIKSFEGFVGRPYKDSVGIPTIGYGATYYPNGKKVTMQDPVINESQASDLLKNMLGTYERAVDSYCVDTITQNQFDALVCFCYNVGAANLKSSTLLKKVNINPNDPSIRNEFMKWNKAGGKELAGLTRRRKAEADLYFSQSTPTVGSKLPTGTTLIVCAATTSEEDADNISESLKEQGFDSSYLWIPDYEPNGKNMFRVYVKSNDVNGALAKAKTQYSDAYLYQVK